MAQVRGLTIQDYFAREELAVANAVPTAEGAVQLAMEHLPITIHGARVLVVGFGRVGRTTAQRFQALGPGSAWRPAGMNNWPGRSLWGWARSIWAVWRAGCAATT